MTDEKEDTNIFASLGCKDDVMIPILCGVVVILLFIFMVFGELGGGTPPPYP